MLNIIIFTHSYVTDWDIELLKSSFEEEGVWIKQTNEILSKDQFWKRKNQNTWSIICGDMIEYSDDMFCKGCLSPYRSNVFALYLDENSKKLNQKFLIQHKKYGNIINEEIVKSNFFSLDFNPFKNNLDKIMTDRIMFKCFPDLWKEWSKEESLV